jgi:D-alanyl-D-alanine carboxypeptidase (penicillin-binding protein 5/6)
MPVLPLSPATTCLAALAVAAALVLPAAAQTQKREEFQTSAPYAILIEADSGTVLFEKNADKLNPPASMSKLMTTELVLHTIEQGKLKWEDEMTISENAWRRGGAPSGGSAMFAALNSRVSVRDLMHGVMIQSGNDACLPSRIS